MMPPAGRNDSGIRTVLVTGSNGQLGCEIRDLAPEYPGLRFVFTDIGELDITDPRAVRVFLDREKIDCVINAAAYTAVDRAETDRAAARRVNADAVANLAKSCRSTGAFLVQVSTDFVFDGRRNTPYRETDRPRPVSAYGRTKRAGERAFFMSAREGMIIRTSWLYSEYGGNFVKTVLRILREKKRMSVVSDQTGSPTYARDLARAILDTLPKVRRGTKSVYHYANEGAASWYDLAEAVRDLSGVPGDVIPIRTQDYPAPARRPAYSVLDKSKIKANFGLAIPHWRQSLSECLKRIERGTTS